LTDDGQVCILHSQKAIHKILKLTVSQQILEPLLQYKEDYLEATFPGVAYCWFFIP
jgi:hypothetical protein